MEKLTTYIPKKDPAGIQIFLSVMLASFNTKFTHLRLNIFGLLNIEVLHLKGATLTQWAHVIETGPLHEFFFWDSL